MNFADFRHFVALMKARPDIQVFYETARGHDEFTFPVFERFMRQSQQASQVIVRLGYAGVLNRLLTDNLIKPRARQTIREICDCR